MATLSWLGAYVFISIIWFMKQVRKGTRAKGGKLDKACVSHTILKHANYTRTAKAAHTRTW